MEEMAQEYNFVLWGVSFIDEFKGWAVGDYGTIIKTEDGGENWTKVAVDTEEGLKDLYFLPDGKTGWATGEMGTILHTTDGGDTWEPQEWESPTRSKNYVFRGISGSSAESVSIAGEWGMVLTYIP
jgi:photosystem II stability/assembly factor-like uncharacterized protein